MSQPKEKLLKSPKRSLQNLFHKKTSFENLCSFLTPKEKFRLLCNSKEILKEFDSKIDDAFIPRQYQEKIKTYENYIEDLFYQILHEMKRNAENKRQKIKLYEFENSMVKYLKYLVNKYGKIIKVALIQISLTEPWKLDFISKLILSLDKNVHLVISMNLTEFKLSEYYNYYIRPSKAINIVEIIDLVYAKKVLLFDEFFRNKFDWSHVKKIIINVKDSDWVKNLDNLGDKNYGYRFLNNASITNLIELDFRFENINIQLLESFMYKCSSVKKLSVNFLTFENQKENIDNSILQFYQNITNLKITTNIDNLDQVLYYFYPILPRIKNFHLEIDNDTNEIYNIECALPQSKSTSIKTKDENDEYETFFKKYLKEDDNKLITSSRDLATKKISFSTKEASKIKRFVHFSYDRNEQTENKQKKNLEKSKVISTLVNLTQCESLIYEIKEQKAIINNSKAINDLIMVLDKNKTHLKYLEINIYNDPGIYIRINQFTTLIQKISECKQLNTFIFGYDLVEKYVDIFNQYFNIGNNLKKIQLIHGTKLNMMKIINEHPNLESINFELIMNEPDYTKKNYENFVFDLNNNRDWKEIELTNYPINRVNLDYLRNKKNIPIYLNACVNLTEIDDLSFKEVMKTFIN